MILVISVLNRLEMAAQNIDSPIHSLIKREHIITNLQMSKINKEAELTP